MCPFCKICPHFFMHCLHFSSLMHGMSGGELVNDNSEAAYNHCPLHCLILFPPPSILLNCISNQQIEQVTYIWTLCIQYGAEIYMLGNKAPRLEGMESNGPLRCLLVKLNCIIFEIHYSWFTLDWITKFFSFKGLLSCQIQDNWFLLA